MRSTSPEGSKIASAVSGTCRDEEPIVTTIEKDPRLVPYPGGNFGTPLELVTGLIVPTSLFFVRCNGPVPMTDPRAWSLTIDGYVDQPRRVHFTELKRLPRRTITAFLECAGNSRTKFVPIP